jgi:hypothetical protein
VIKRDANIDTTSPPPARTRSIPTKRHHPGADDYQRDKQHGNHQRLHAPARLRPAENNPPF